MKCCLNRKVLLGLGAIAVAIFFFAPSARGALPLLLVAACPVSMMVMMSGMSKMGSSGKSCLADQADPQKTIELKDAEIARLEAMLHNNTKTNNV